MPAIKCGTSSRKRAETTLKHSWTEMASAEHIAPPSLFGPLNVTLAFLPLLKRSKGAIVNNLSLNRIRLMLVANAVPLTNSTHAARGKV